jgi:hypothetical protein
MAGSKQCPKCSGSMIEGFVIDRTHSGVTVGSWVEGAPQESMWTGIRTKGRANFEVASWRCSRCGFLEHYATGGPSRYEQAQSKMLRVALVAAVAAAAAAAVMTGLLIS